MRSMLNTSTVVCKKLRYINGFSWGWGPFCRNRLSLSQLGYLTKSVTQVKSYSLIIDIRHSRNFEFNRYTLRLLVILNRCNCSAVYKIRRKITSALIVSFLKYLIIQSHEDQGHDVWRFKCEKVSKLRLDNKTLRY